ncbi:hypothetical protein BC943DRAFT_315125 [Umbelopsis sp. AD052]|nr:hypothetical protein BC943DRAFT_315125 [Umbelopsis sp. AD052]
MSFIFSQRSNANKTTSMDYNAMTQDLNNIPPHTHYNELRTNLQSFLDDENLIVPHITKENTVKDKDVTDIMELVQAESQGTKEQRQETRAVANKLLMTIEELDLMRQPVKEAAAHISQIQQDVLVSSDALEQTKSGML